MKMMFARALATGVLVARQVGAQSGALVLDTQVLQLSSEMSIGAHSEALGHLSAEAAAEAKAEGKVEAKAEASAEASAEAVQARISAYSNEVGTAPSARLATSEDASGPEEEPLSEGWTRNLTREFGLMLRAGFPTRSI
ncbi:unnamed protein product [Prorocentrum cordatum]|uniref:Uncharacterized protein n=1 Tax=Prorocentrum cordatum TaxID=2364126 RepID=A0ABN9X277_9DINO|nr:unnamed protein product [Polarella glacialis]